MSLFHNINKQFLNASYCGYSDVVKLLINLGADVHTRNDKAIIDLHGKGINR